MDRSLPAIYFLLEVRDLLVPHLNGEINIPGILSAIGLTASLTLHGHEQRAGLSSLWTQNLDVRIASDVLWFSSQPSRSASNSLISSEHGLQPKTCGRDYDKQDDEALRLCDWNGPLPRSRHGDGLCIRIRPVAVRLIRELARKKNSGASEHKLGHWLRRRSPQHEGAA